jgi:putative FmdB family regulatory protein
MYFKTRTGEMPMPTYQYICYDCKKRFEVYLTYAEYDQAEMTCPKCHSFDVRRRIGRIRIARTEESRLENLMDTENLDGIEEDPKALGRLMRQMGSELGEEMGPEFDEVVSRLESGQGPEEIERDLPDLGADLDDGDSFID